MTLTHHDRRARVTSTPTNSPAQIHRPHQTSVENERLLLTTSSQANLMRIAWLRSRDAYKVPHLSAGVDDSNHLTTAACPTFVAIVRALER
ncbi:unnamed protein product [Taenia asiatica]|uniref:Uncharacterized protein n=1 Tax=Taenia asiatica TaxID=60517 RepID=A0A0R3W0D7_TAEAS|nr:unnamed protein product [Taenia asiatica]